MDVWKHDIAIKKLNERFEELNKELEKFSKDIDGIEKAVKNIETFIQNSTKKTKEKMVIDAMENIVKKTPKKKGKKDALQYD